MTSKRITKTAKTNPGPAPTEFTQEQLDQTREWLGKEIRPSRVVARIEEKYRIGRDLAYRLIEATREDVIRSFQQQGTAADPMTAVYLFYEEAMADETREFQHRLAAAAGIIKLLGLERIVKSLDAGGVEEFLAGVMMRSRAKAAAELVGAAH